MSPSLIEWTEETWNPTVGCSRVSPGCDHCYAISVAHRAMQSAHEGLTIRLDERVDWTGEVRLLHDRLDAPLKRRTPTTYFVDSMSDVFHKDVPESFVELVFTTMAAARQHTFQVLTKRPHRMRGMLNDRPARPAEVDAGCELGVWPSIWDRVTGGVPAPNVWLGTSIESDQYSFRADHLRATPAAIRFLSLEPLLGPLPHLRLDGIDWVIVGGESGPGARPMHPSWARDIRNRCVEAGVPFFFKQWGEWAGIEPIEFDRRRGDRILNWAGEDDDLGGGFVRRLGKKAAGHELDGETWQQMPERVSA